MGKKRPTIALSMIVRNESAVIRRCLRSVKPFIDSWAISDTGSTDGTQAIIREELAGIPGTLIERPWVDFSTNRNEALEEARKSGAEFLLILDADEELTTDPGFTLEDLAGDSYSANFQIVGTDSKWHRKLLLRTAVPWAYNGVMDEYLDDRGYSNLIIENCLVRSYSDGARSADGLTAKFERDIAVLRRAVERDPAEPRNWFYLGQRLGGAGHLDESIAAYRRRLEIEGGFDEERYGSLLQIAANREERGDDWRDVARSYLEAYNARPTRAEPLLAIASLHATHREFATAEIFCRAAARMPRPQDSLLIHEPVYAWLSNDTLAGVLAEQGKLTEARQLLEKLVVLPQVPADQKPRMLENIEIIRAAEKPAQQAEQLGPDEGAYTRQAETLRSAGVKGLRAMARQFISRPSLQALPSPARWLWLFAFGRAPWLPALAAIACPALLCWVVAPVVSAHYARLALYTSGLAPLLWMLGRRKLQDTTIAALTLAAVGSATHGQAHWLFLAVFALLGCKEASALALPAVAAAWLLTGHAPLPLACSVSLALAAWAAVTFALFGRMTVPLLRSAAGGHATPYTLTQQRGAPHRLLVDLALVSPVPAALAVLGAQNAPILAGITLALIAAHAAAPVRNVRLILAADLLMRAVAVTALGDGLVYLAAIPLWLASDAWIGRKLRHVYDPTTSALAGELGMTRQPST